MSPVGPYSVEVCLYSPYVSFGEVEELGNFCDANQFIHVQFCCIAVRLRSDDGHGGEPLVCRPYLWSNAYAGGVAFVDEMTESVNDSAE